MKNARLLFVFSVFFFMEAKTLFAINKNVPPPGEHPSDALSPQSPNGVPETRDKDTRLEPGRWLPDGADVYNKHKKVEGSNELVPIGPQKNLDSSEAPNP